MVKRSWLAEYLEKHQHQYGWHRDEGGCHIFPIHQILLGQPALDAVVAALRETGDKEYATSDDNPCRTG